MRSINIDNRYGMFLILAIALILNNTLTAQVADTLEMVWNDEFDGTQLDEEKWETCPEWQRQGLSYWEADNHQLTGSGELRLDITQSGDSVLCGAIRSKSHYYQKYGYFEVRCKVPGLHGGWAAFWLMPDENNPGEQGVDGTEVDIFETINGMDGKINHALHWDGYGDDHQSTGKSLTRPDLYDDSYHTFGMLWTPSEYVFYIDDVETWRTSAGGVSQVEQYIKLTLEVTDASWAGNWEDQVEKPIYWYIDYVRTYKLPPGTLVENITLTGGDITENNGTLQVEASILPENASDTSLSWRVENGTGKARVDENGVVTGIMDGDVRVIAASEDGSFVEASTVVNISKQIVSRSEINLIRNGYFDDVENDGTPSEWISPANTAVVDGVCIIDPVAKENIWEYRLQQAGGWGLNTTDTYAFSFLLSAEESATFNVDFEDARDAVGYKRLGESVHAYALEGASDWTFDSPVTQTKYLFDVKFTNLVEESNEQFMFMLGHHDPAVAIDSVELINTNDLERLTPGYIPVEFITVSGESRVAVGEGIQLSAAVEPGNATLKDVNWNIVPGTGSASIDETGLLTGTEHGLVSVQAMARDDSKITGKFEVSVTDPSGTEQQWMNTLELFPNPAINELQVILPHEKNRVSIYDSTGKLMDEVFISGNKHKFDISHYASGVYIVKTGKLVAKFIK